MMGAPADAGFHRAGALRGQLLKKELKGALINVSAGVEGTLRRAKASQAHIQTGALLAGRAFHFRLLHHHRLSNKHKCHKANKHL